MEIYTTILFEVALGFFATCVSISIGIYIGREYITWERFVVCMLYKVECWRSER